MVVEWSTHSEGPEQLVSENICCLKPCVCVSVMHVCHLCAAGRTTGEKPSYWWVGGLGMAVLVLGLVGVLAYLKTRGNARQKKKE